MDDKRIIDILMNKRVFIQMNSGTQIDGEFLGVDNEAFYLANAKVIGKNAIAEVDFIAASKSQFSHINTEPKKITPNNKYDKKDPKKKTKPKTEEKKD
ncbi:hypothetical protein MMKA1_p-00080 (plasmid) [Methanococcus maripaludis KA1]|uniref:Uncharacterized protein n=1 Tax=Methanococcus maripaludis KA1 TaxID=637914 RepID=A0A2Z5PUH3_METMI|nr:hypothetical protein [Methanococcus maripaludis]BAP62081.1 hypothetical protein MMKA1_p-00080 [Methanococcus maripaludis KA1]